MAYYFMPGLDWRYLTIVVLFKHVVFRNLNPIEHIHNRTRL